MPSIRLCSALSVLALLLCAAHAVHAQAGNAESPPALASADAAAAPTQQASAPTSARPLASTTASPGRGGEVLTSDGWLSPSPWALYGVPAFVLLASVAAITRIARALGPRTWSLADALSEEVKVPAYTDAVPATEGTPAIPRTLILDNDRHAVLVPEMRASISRVIAMMGMMAILFLFLGFGVFAIFEYGATGRVSEHMDRISSYLTTGLTLFAPYLVNQFSSIFKSTSGSK